MVNKDFGNKLADFYNVQVLRKFLCSFICMCVCVFYLCVDVDGGGCVWIGFGIINGMQSYGDKLIFFCSKNVIK